MSTNAKTLREAYEFRLKQWQAERALADRLADILRSVEWAAYRFAGTYPCPNCARDEYVGHEADCELGAALAAHVTARKEQAG